MKKLYWLLILILTGSGCYKILPSEGGGQTDIKSEARNINPSDIALPEGYIAEAIASGLTFPTAVAFDEQGQLYVIEAGYSYGEVFLEPKLLRVSENGNLTTIATGEKNGPWTGVTYHDGNFYIAEGGQMTGGKLLRISKDGTVNTLIENLPSMGDHHTNGPVVGPDGQLYFGIGTATNSGVVGPDNYKFGWLKRHPEFHDIPCQDITLTGQNYTSEIPLTSKSGKQTTGAYSAYGTPTTQGQVIKGSIPCSGAVLKISPEGGNMELVAWGFRNPFGLAFSPKGKLFVSDNAFDVRGSRPIWGTGDYLWKAEQGKWYGWPDFSGGTAFNGYRFSPPGDKGPQPLLAQHPNKPPNPAATLGVHSSSNGMDFSRNSSFGYQGEAFIAQFGDMAPGVGKVLSPVGYKVVRVNVENGVITDFAANKGKKTAPASKLNTGGLERPVSVKFSPDGQSLYIVDFGIMETGDNGPEPKLKTGVIWKITKNRS
ncbi:PQQ-dependent sugar dehydrogenase [Pontibacter cellulosilyticus]|uniref:PQQ-dependent sugar dehydrogenase n=1 Tax=Pontibacter cellulosilyticus TaxID=1720253 RepID=A0A923SIK4_9BACT|nr:PQQ-dependent sugar dehydrogenase [Pontibacter cellulosilyticus]MBC5992843.1 PQQ-dependent sugar dehydrogenase [Pontibacter cellulosilyticus]